MRSSLYDQGRHCRNVLLRGQDLHLHLEVMSLSYCPSLLSRHKTHIERWSGWQELNLRGHVPKTCGWPLPYTRIVKEGVSALSGSIPSRTQPGATCAPRPPDRAALPSRRRWTCTPSEFHR